MFSLIAFAVIGAYLLLVWLGARLGRKIATSTGAGKVIARGAAILGAALVLLPVFWDVPPTLIAHRYYCATDAGAHVYKSPQQWYGEKSGKVIPLAPQVVETDEERRQGSMMEVDHDLRYNTGLIVLNARAIDIFLTIKRHRLRLIDPLSGEVLVENIDYSAFSYGFKRPWFSRSGCDNLRANLPSFKSVKEEFKTIGKVVR